MKKDIHPKYEAVTVKCACGHSFETRSTKQDIHLEICSQCHPFFTGKQKFVDSDGRIDKFKKKYANFNRNALKAKKAVPAPEPVAAEADAPKLESEKAE